MSKLKLNLSKKEKIIVISLSLFIILLIGGTVAYFTASASNNNTISGTAASASLSLNVSLASTQATGNLIPQPTSTMSQALVGTNSKSCIDGNGNTVCQVYKIQVTNNSGATVKASSTVELTGGTYPNLKWEEIATATTLKSERVTNGKATTTWLSEETLNGGQTKTYYLAVWINETGGPQSDNGTFRGKITFNVG